MDTKILKSINAKVIFVKGKRHKKGGAIGCELCYQLITPFEIRVTLMDGKIICNQCCEVADDLMKVV